jgi:hypothetical protein
MKNGILLGLIDRHIEMVDARNELDQFVEDNNLHLPFDKTVHAIYRGYLWEIRFPSDDARKYPMFKKLNEAGQVSVMKNGQEITSIRVDKK